jgi:hypothetical protein
VLKKAKKGCKNDKKKHILAGNADLLGALDLKNEKKGVILYNFNDYFYQNEEKKEEKKVHSQQKKNEKKTKQNKTNPSKKIFSLTKIQTKNLYK